MDWTNKPAKRLFKEVFRAPWPSGHGVRLSHVMLETVAGSNPAGATLLGMLAGWTASNATKGGHCGLSTKEPKP